MVPTNTRFQFSFKPTPVDITYCLKFQRLIKKHISISKALKQSVKRKNLGNMDNVHHHAKFKLDDSELSHCENVHDDDTRVELKKCALPLLTAETPWQGGNLSANFSQLLCVSHEDLSHTASQLQYRY